MNLIPSEIWLCVNLFSWPEFKQKMWHEASKQNVQPDLKRWTMSHCKNDSYRFYACVVKVEVESNLDELYPSKIVYSVLIVAKYFEKLVLKFVSVVHP